MSVLINKKRCDNANVCPCISECPTNAFYWDEENNTVAVDNNLCINCRHCMIACEAGAIKVARDEIEYQKIKTEYDEDIMTIQELFQDRYGASIVDEKLRLNINELDQLAKNSNSTLLIEFYYDEESRCLINSIPISEIVSAINKPISYRKINIENIKLLGKYKINILPALIIIENGNVLYKYEDFLDISEKSKILTELNKI